MSVLDVLDPMVSVMVTAFVNGLWQGVVLLGLVWGLLRAFETRRRLNATTRYAVWCITLATLVVLPIGAGLLAAMQPVSTEQSLPVKPIAALPDRAPDLVLEASPRAAFTPGEGLALDAAFSGEPRVAPAEPLEEEAVVAPLLRPSRRPLTLPRSIQEGLPFVVGAWLLVALVLLARVAWGYAYLRRLKRQSIALPAPYQQRLAAWRRAYGLRRPARIAGSESLAAPVAAGLRDPMILVPLALFDHLTEEQFDQVVLHEWAHLQRWDDWTNLLQRVAEAILFFHPAVLWVGRQMNREREMACDDWVVWRTHRPRSYATCLTRLVELNLQSRALLVAPGMAASKERLFERVGRLLDQGRHVTATLSKTGMVTMGLVLAATVLLMVRLAPIFTPSAPVEETAEPVPAPDVSEPQSLTRLAEPDVLVLPEPTRANADGQTVIAQRVSVNGAGLLAGLDSTATVRLLQRETALMIQAFRPDTILAYRTAQQPPLRLQPTALSIQSTQQVLRVSSLRLQQSTARLNAIPPTRREGSGQRRDLSKASWIRVLKAAARIASSGDKARFLGEAAPRLVQDEEVYVAYIETARTIGSPGDQARALTALLANHRLGSSTLVVFLDATKAVVSGGDKTRLLLRVADVLPDDDAVRAAYVEIAETLASPSDYRRAMQALK